MVNHRRFRLCFQTVTTVNGNYRILYIVIDNGHSQPRKSKYRPTYVAGYVESRGVRREHAVSGQYGTNSVKNMERSPI